MKVTRETDYAIRCLIHLASAGNELCYVDDIARLIDAPKSFVAKIMQKLAKLGFVQSSRGAKGGYTLALLPEQITLLDVIEKMQGRVCLNQCVLDNTLCDRHSYCMVHNIWVSLSSLLRERLSGYTLDMFVTNSP